MSYNILSTIGSKFTVDAKKILEQGGKVDCFDLNQRDFEKKIHNYNIILVGLGLNIDKEQIDKAKNLNIIASATTGLDHINVEYAKSKNIKIISLKGETEFLNTITGTAELAFGLMIDILRMTNSAFDSVKNYQWDRERFRGHNLFGQTMGIVGLGRLGSWMAKYANAFSMRVIATDPYVEDEFFLRLNTKKVDFEKLTKESDIISIHVHLNEETEKMFNEKVFHNMKNTSYLINTSRGRVVNEKDILEALQTKQIAGYATDVLANELSFNNNLVSHPLVEYAKSNSNLIIVPHIGGMTFESRKLTDIFIAKKIIKEIKLK